jgi:hypothetical protein
MSDMSKSFVLALAITLLASISFAQSIAGIQVGEPMSVLDKLNLKPTAKASMGSMDAVKYKLANGNDLSVTYESPAGRIVYLECDWNGNPEGVAADFPGFEFGITTLEEIRIANGSNGFSYKSNAMSTAYGDLITLNDYSIKDKPGLVAVFVTSLNIAESRRRRDGKELGADDVARNLRLHGLILAEETYLDGVWGKEKIYDKEVKPINWTTTDPATVNPPPKPQ